MITYSAHSWVSGCLGVGGPYGYDDQPNQTTTARLSGRLVHAALMIQLIIRPVLVAGDPRLEIVFWYATRHQNRDCLTQRAATFQRFSAT